MAHACAGRVFCTHVFSNGFGRPHQRTRVREARPLFVAFCEIGGNMMNVRVFETFSSCEKVNLLGNHCVKDVKIEVKSMEGEI